MDDPHEVGIWAIHNRADSGMAWVPTNQFCSQARSDIVRAKEFIKAPTEVIRNIGHARTVVLAGAVNAMWY